MKESRNVSSVASSYLSIIFKTYTGPTWVVCMKIQSPGLSIFGVILTLLVLVSWTSATQTSDSVFLFTRKMNVLISYGYRGILGGSVRLHSARTLRVCLRFGVYKSTFAFILMCCFLFVHAGMHEAAFSREIGGLRQHEPGGRQCLCGS